MGQSAVSIAPGEPGRSTSAAIYRFDGETARRFLAHLLDPAAGCVEFRVFKATKHNGFILPAEEYSRTLGGWFDDLEILFAGVGMLKGVSGFVTVNPVRRELLARGPNRVAKIDRGSGSSDVDIACLRHVFIDIDPIRPADIGATDAERDLALGVRDAILAAFPSLRSASIWGCSGNGGWILARLPDYPVDAAHNALVARLLTTLARRFDTPGVRVDPTTKNPSRIMGIPGTVKCKGADYGDRPHRLATMDSPEGHLPVPLDLESWLEEHDDAPATVIGARPGRAGGAANSTPRGRGAGSAVARARKCVFRMKDSIAGSKGHTQLYAVAVALVDGFGLAREDAYPLFAEWNAAKARPPESDSQIRHKLDDAIANNPTPSLNLLDATSAKDRHGGLPGAEGGRSSSSAGCNVEPCAYINNPDHLARTMLAREFSHPDGLKLRFWRDEFFEWDGSSYSPMPNREVSARVTRSVVQQFREDHEALLLLREEQIEAGGDDKGSGAPRLLPATTGTVRDVTQALSELTLLAIRDVPSQPAWLGGPAPLPFDSMMACRNGLVDLASAADDRAGILAPTPRFFNRSAVAFDFDPDARDPDGWLAFLQRLWPDDPESVDLLQEWMGYLLTPSTAFQKIAMLIGPPRSGKGTITRVIRELAGHGNFVAPTFSHMATNFGSQPLIGKSVAVFTDARVGVKTDTAALVERLLAISGEDAQTIDRKNQEAFNGTLSARFMIVSNELPDLRESSGAMTSRLLFLQLTESFLGREDTDLFSNLMSEMPGILRWAIAGWRRLHRLRRFTAPKSCEGIAQEMGDLSSPLMPFLRERCRFGDDCSVGRKALFSAWAVWCDANRKRPGLPESFGRALRAIRPSLKDGPRVSRDDGSRDRTLLGIDLLPEEGPARIPASEWLRVYLSRGPAFKNDALRDAESSGYSASDLFEAARAISAQDDESSGRKLWSIVRCPF